MRINFTYSFDFFLKGALACLNFGTMAYSVRDGVSETDLHIRWIVEIILPVRKRLVGEKALIRQVIILAKKQNTKGTGDGESGKQRKGLTDKQKKALIVTGATLAAVAAAYGIYKYNQMNPDSVKRGREVLDSFIANHGSTPISYVLSCILLPRLFYKRDISLF